MKGFKNVRAYILGKGIITTDIAVENGRIVEVGENLDITQPFDYQQGQVVVAGFIDEHIHGAGGGDSFDGSEEALSTISNFLAKEGTTTFLATTMTQSREKINKVLEGINSYIKKAPKNGARVLGIHLEGPFISRKHVGAQPLEHVQEQTIERFDEYYKSSGNNLKIVSLAPEEPGAEELIPYIASLGIVVSAGHTDAGYYVMNDAVEKGLTCVTHTFNAQKGVHHRDLGTAGAALLNDKLYCEAICDLIHLDAATIKLLIKNKPHDKIILITDAMRAKGMADGISELGGQKVIVKNGEARLENGALAGSTLKMNEAIKNLVLKCGVKFTDAIDFATINPAKNLNIFDDCGSIEKGKRADFAVLDEEFNVCLTIRGGEKVHKI